MYLRGEWLTRSQLHKARQRVTPAGQLTLTLSYGETLLDAVSQFGHRQVVMRPRMNEATFRRPSDWVARLVLAMLCLRALVPAGFMLMPIDGRLGVVLCDSYAAGAMHHHGGHHHSGHAHPDPTCPYAQSAGPAPLPTLPTLSATPIASVLLLPTQFSQTRAQFGPPRQQSPRAPPPLA